MQKLEIEIDKRKLAKSKELIKQNIERWEKQNNFIHGFNTTEDYKKDKLIIPCAYAFDNAYIFPTLVVMTSLAENAGNNTFYSIYVLIDSGLTEENKKILKSVEYNHIHHCEVIFQLLSDKYKNEKTDKRIKTPAYYRLDLPIILHNISRIIWMDGDTAVFEDLAELINLDMKGNYIMGFLDSVPEAIDKFGIINSTVLCAGVLLMDLDALRQNNMTQKFEKFMIEQKENINQHDQTIINVVCQGKIAPLPPKYGMWCFEAKIHALKHNNRQRKHLQYNETEFIYAYYHPAILHYVWPKPYWRRKKPVFNKEWWNYAKKTGYLNGIYYKSPKFVRWLLL
jgi:lipopolysaccharide biosynthesis glycosyltransferase